MKAVKIALLAFASAGDILGTGETTLDLAPRTTLGQLKTLLEERHPALGALWSRLAIAVNGDLRPDDTALADGDEVALLPPVSGGSGKGLGERAREATALTEDPLDADEVARRVADPSYLRSFGAARRSTALEKRKNRSTNFFDNASTRGPDGPNWSWTNWVRV